MEERYRRMSKMGVRNIDGFNSRVSDALMKMRIFRAQYKLALMKKLAIRFLKLVSLNLKRCHIVVVVDEMADLMMVTYEN